MTEEELKELEELIDRDLHGHGYNTSMRLITEIRRLRLEATPNEIVQVKELREEIRRLRKALQWYADEKNYTTQSLGKCPIENSYVADDMGERAREALEGK